jgi:hypothetical protein
VYSYFICPQSDEQLIALARENDIYYITMTEEEYKDKTFFHQLINSPLILDALSQTSPFTETKEPDYLVDINFACHPFLKYDTALKIINQFRHHPYYVNMVSVIEERNPLWDEASCLFYNPGRLADTKTNIKYFKPSHLAHCYRWGVHELTEMQLAMKLHPIPCVDLSPIEQIDIDTPADLEFARLLDKPEYVMPELEAIAFGTGPSFYEYIKQPHNYKHNHPEFGEWHTRLYGCGVVPNYINNLTAYGYGDTDHINNIPDPDGPHHPGCKTFAGTRNLKDFETYGKNLKPIPLLPYANLDLPHGESSGGMALSLACLHHNVVGIVGFDGNPDAFPPTVYTNFVEKFRHLINYWQNRGRRIVSLMPNSVFNPIIEPAIKPIGYKSDTV